ncbi:MAG: energy-coupling factor ABC transporter ATP-binding protein [Syntrophobacteraceae bacterium]|jgi:cobalt transport protein ATP-binding subunit|nr:energy-coupling factor ABC transporter ATP-binding protein [Syntrophobacteraceae bacterium]
MISIEDLSHSYPDGTQALKSVSLRVRSGELVLFCGANGSGKTTLLRHLNGLLKPTRGRVLLDGMDVSEHASQAVTRVGMVFQDPDSQILGETVWEDVAFGPENLGLAQDEVRRRVEQALALTELHELAHKSCLWLSGGERKRLAIAGVLALSPETLVLDEPFANLDYPSTRQILTQIVQLHSKGHTILLSTHEVEKVVAHVDRIAVLAGGELKLVGPPETVLPELAAHGVRPPCHHLMGLPVASWINI